MFHREIDGVLVSLVRDLPANPRPFLLVVKATVRTRKTRYKSYNAAVRAFDRVVVGLEAQAQQSRIQAQIRLSHSQSSNAPVQPSETIEAFLARGGQIRTLKAS